MQESGAKEQALRATGQAGVVGAKEQAQLGMCGMADGFKLYVRKGLPNLSSNNTSSGCCSCGFVLVLRFALTERAAGNLGLVKGGGWESRVKKARAVVSGTGALG